MKKRGRGIFQFLMERFARRTNQEKLTLTMSKETKESMIDLQHRVGARSISELIATALDHMEIDQMEKELQEKRGLN